MEQINKILGMFNKTANSIDLVTIFRDRLIQEYAEKNSYQFILKGSNG